MKVVALVPMKLNNERLPNKNVKTFTNGKPLCQYILDTLLKVRCLDDIYVYCSKEEIRDYIPQGVHYLKRSERLDQNTTKINEVLQEFAKEIEADVYVLAHVTAPFMEASTIEEGIQKVTLEGYESAHTVLKLQEFLWMNQKPMNYDVASIARTQDLPPVYRETTGLYIYRRELILDKNRRIGENPYLLEVNKIEAMDINEPEDFMMADAIFNYNHNKYNVG